MAYLTLKKIAKLTITEWLALWSTGDQSAANKLYDALAPYLQRTAKDILHNHHERAQISPAELMQETWIRMSVGEQKNFANRREFFGTAVRAMHFALIDMHRAREKQQRLDQAIQQRPHQEPQAPEQYELLYDAIATLEHDHPRAAEALLLLKLGGFSQEEIANLQGTSLSTVRRDVTFAEAWVKAQVPR